MSYVLHADAYMVEVALGWYTGGYCSDCGTPIPRDFYGAKNKSRCDDCRRKTVYEGNKEKVCQCCGKTFRIHRDTRKFCSRPCANKMRGRRNK